MAEKNTANICFEKQNWDAACVLWGHIPAKQAQCITCCACYLFYNAEFVNLHAKNEAEQH
jgi:type I restriction enzyme M protein